MNKEEIQEVLDSLTTTIVGFDSFDNPSNRSLKLEIELISKTVILLTVEYPAISIENSVKIGNTIYELMEMIDNIPDEFLDKKEMIQIMKQVIVEIHVAVKEGL